MKDDFITSQSVGYVREVEKKLLIIIVFDAVHELPKAMPKDVIKVSNLYHYSKHKKTWHESFRKKKRS